MGIMGGRLWYDKMGMRALPVLGRRGKAVLAGGAIVGAAIGVSSGRRGLRAHSSGGRSITSGVGYDRGASMMPESDRSWPYNGM